MLKNYFKTAWRNLVKNKTFSFINVFGLSIGLAACLLISAFLYDELSYDRAPRQAGQIYRVELHFLENAGYTDFANVDVAVGRGMQRAFPEILDVTRFYFEGSVFIDYQGKSFKEESMGAVDSNFLDIFSIPMLEGDSHTALREPNSIVVSKSFAKKYFGDASPVGKLLSFRGASHKITGVMEGIPANSHFHFDALVSMNRAQTNNAGTWSNVGFFTYLLLKKDTDPRKLEAKFPQLVTQYVTPEIAHDMNIPLAEAQKSANTFHFYLRPLTDIHLYANGKYEAEANGNIHYIYIFGALAFFILLLACVNFTNLSTASSSKRSREVGIRKVLGSLRQQLIGQFLAESILLTCIAVIFAVSLVLLLLPYFNSLAGKHFHIGSFLNYQAIGAFAALTLLVGIVAGIYPAFFLSGFRTIAVLKGGGDSLKAGGKKQLRSGLVVLQFAISTALIISTIIVYRQLHYMQNIQLGYDKDQVLVIRDTYTLPPHTEKVLKQQLLQDPRVLNASISWTIPGSPNMDGTVIAAKQKESGSEGIHTNIYHIDYDYIPLLGMKMVAGRNFSPSFPSDSDGVIINQTAARELGWVHTDPIGKGLDRSATSQYTVVGVVEDFHYASAKQKIAPLIMVLGRNGGSILLKVKTANIPSLLADIKRQWDAFKPSTSFTYAFLDEGYGRMYAVEQRTGQIFTVFAVIAVLIASLGLFGLAAFTAEQRAKEIGIRKVLGASVQQLLLLLSGEFLRLVGIACIIAIPLTWWAMHTWLQDFAYRTQIPAWIFIAAGLLSIVIAMATISFQAARSALANPVKTLRSE
ncbi:MAG TPA: ABC transporter permease [Puia sp.]|nr:ABC transporter permease [Puia sp.]